MRPGSILLVVACVLLATCAFAAKGDHARMLRMSSPDFAQANDAVSNKVRLLRSSEIADNEINNEERGRLPKGVLMSEEGLLAGENGILKALPQLQKNRKKADARFNDQVLPKMPVLSSEADIKKHYDTILKWFLEGKNPKKVKKEMKISSLKKELTTLKLMENKNYQLYMTFVKFFNIVKNKNPTKEQLMKARYDEAMQMKEKLTLDDAIKLNFDKYLLWHVDKKAMDEERIDVFLKYVMMGRKDLYPDDQIHDVIAGYKRFEDLLEISKGNTAT